MGLFLRQCWYQLGWSSEVPPEGLLARTILDEPIVAWRDRTGAVKALLDRCPHRFAPLSAGRAMGDRIACGYHGLAFDGAGACVHNPHGPTTSSMRVRNFPIVERHDAIWIWTGDPDGADPALIPDLGFIDQTPESARITAAMFNEANYQLLADNILDLSHIDFIHPETLGGMMTGAKTKASRTRDGVTVEWQASESETPLGYKPMVPEGRCAVWMQVRWQAPALMQLDVAVTPAGVSHTEIDVMNSLHNFTPATATTSHYFLCSTRRFATDNVQITEDLRTALMHAFLNEDKPMIEKQQRRMGTDDLWSLNPILLPVDAGAVLARRILDAKISAEQNAIVSSSAIAAE